MLPHKPTLPLVSFLLLFLCCLVGSTEAQVTCTPVFTNEYKAYSNIRPSTVKVLSDGSLLVAGRGLAGTSSNYDGFAARLNPNGTQIWSYFIGGGGNDNFTGIAPLTDGTIILYGSTQSFGHPEGKGWLVHIDAAGAVLSSFLLGSSITGNDQVEAVQQYTDGDIAGTFNVNNGSVASDPVVFKMGLDGTLRWTSRFDNGNDDSFTGLAFSGDTLYAAGYFTAAGTKQAVITLLNVNNGAHLTSTNVYYGDPGYREEIAGLEIYGGMISYGLYITGTSAGSFSNEIILAQTDLAGQLLHPSTYASDAASDIGGSTVLIPIRTADSGFYVLRTVNGSLPLGSPGVNKVNKYGVVEWGLGIIPTYNYAAMTGIDRTPDGGVVAVGWFTTYLGGYNDVMRLVRMTASGELGSCDLPTATMASGLMSFQQKHFTWASQPAISPLSQATTPNVPVAAPMTFLADPPGAPCTSSVCVDKTPIPAGCNKTYNIVYSTDRSSAIYDVIPTTDGGKLAVGGLTMPTTYQAPWVDGLVIKYQANGDVQWAKNYNFVPGYDLSFSRVIRLADGNMLAIGNDYYDIDYGFYSDIVMMKFDLGGNVLWVKSLSEANMSDVGATPDGGFILLSGSIVIRYDANANIIWQKGVTHQWTISSYQSVFCSGNHVDIAFHSNNFNNQIGVDRLSLATGDEIWSRAYTTNSTSAAISRIISKNDSVYLFLSNYIQYAPAPVTNLVIKLDTSGNLYQAQTLGADAINATAVTLTSDGNFALASQITTAGGNSFLLTKLRPNGTALWSNNFISIPYQPNNIHTQGMGFIVPGVQHVLHSGKPNFTNSTVLKLDKSGQFEAGAASGCQPLTHPFIATPYNSVSPVNNALSGIAPSSLPIVNGSVYAQNTAVSPTLLCYTPGNCNTVTLEQKGAACSLGDTLVYYLDNSSNCDAAATWNYDPSFFKPGVSLGDSIQLIVQQAGSSVVSAQVEGYCSLNVQNKIANIVLSGTNVNLGPDTVVCDNASVTLIANPGFASYQWNDNSTGTSLVVTAPGKYYVTTTNQCGGLHSDTVLVTAADSLFHLTPDTTVCNQDLSTLAASSGYADYQWSPSYDLQPQGNKALVFPAITTTYTVTAQRRPGCMVTRSVVVTALSSPPITLGKDTSICSGDTLLLDAGGAFNSYQWSTGATGRELYVSAAGVYSIAALYSNGCASKDTFRLIEVYHIPKPSLKRDSVLCLGSDKTLNAGPGYTSYLWSNGSTGPSIDISQTGVYWVSVTDDHGCQVSDTAHVLRTAVPPGSFMPSDTTICQYGDLKITTLEPFVSYSWSDLSSGSSLTVKQPGTYWVTVTDENGCVGKDSILVTGKQCLLGLFVPSAFTPNGDGHNDRLRPLCFGTVRGLYFAVFNRWGQRVFETQSPTSEGWDGTVNGTPSPSGTYVWYCRYQLDGLPAAIEKGTFILVR